MLEGKEEWLLPNQLQQSYADENKIELVLTAEYSSVHSAITHTVGYFIPSLSLVTVGYVL